MFIVKKSDYFKTPQGGSNCNVCHLWISFEKKMHVLENKAESWRKGKDSEDKSPAH
jgi:hypothetical protein